MKHTKVRAGAVIAAGAMLSSLGFAGPALAATVDQGSVDGTNQENTASPALVNPSATTQLSIHKYLGATTGQPNNGTVQTVTGTALDGVPFDVYKVEGVDLTTNDGWKAAAALYNGAITVDADNVPTVDGYTLTKAGTVTTAGGGVANFKGEVALYVVVENLDAATALSTVDGPVEASTITPSAPFFVTLPMTDPNTRDSWMYDVHVCPKNQSDTITKAVEDKGTVTTDNGNVGKHEIVYTINSSINDGSNPLGAYEVFDNLDPALTLNKVEVALSDDTPLTYGTDYVVFAFPGDAGAAVQFDGTTPVADGATVQIVFTAEGRAKLEANRALEVVTTLTTTMGDIDADGVVPNKATFIPNSDWAKQNDVPTTPPDTPPTTPPTDTPGIPSNDVETRYGNIVVNKFDPRTDAADMTGATFALFPAVNGACDEVALSADPINTMSIDNEGKDAKADGYNQVVFEGLQVSTFWNNTDQAGNITEGGTVYPLNYCLVETVAPTGYNLDAQPHLVTIDYRTGTTDTPAVATADVANEKSNLNNSLPLTGGQGVMILSIGGLLLIGGGVGYYAYTNRRKNS